MFYLTMRHATTLVNNVFTSSPTSSRHKQLIPKLHISHWLIGKEGIWRFGHVARVFPRSAGGGTRVWCSHAMRCNKKDSFLTRRKMAAAQQSASCGRLRKVVELIFGHGLVVKGGGGSSRGWLTSLVKTSPLTFDSGGMSPHHRPFVIIRLSVVRTTNSERSPTINTPTV